MNLYMISSLLIFAIYAAVTLFQKKHEEDL